jgi:predicted Ser/Thr protein kinase
MAGAHQPFRVAGHDAVVYRLENAAPGYVALRCFLTDKLDNAVLARYQRLSKDSTLRRLRTSEHSPLVQYVHLFPDGLLLPGPDFRSLSEPVIAMEWIDGPTLIEAVDRAARQREHRVLNALANSWLRAVAANREVDFSHGSLTGQNVMVDLERGPVFVDYDTAWWPGAVSLSKQKPPATYSHPRGVASAPERRDDFAALLIYTSLRALAIDPSLRDDFGDPPARIDGAILFSASDLASPNKSKLFERLRDLGDDEFQGVLGILREACRSGVDTVPPIDDAWQAARAAVVEVRTEPEPVVLPPLPAPPVAADASWFGVAPETDRDRQTAAFIEAVVERDPANVVELWPSVRQSPEVIPYAIQATNLAREFVQQRVAKAMDAGDDNEIVAAVEQAQALVIAVPPGARRAYRRALRTVDLRAGLIEALERDDRQQLSDMAVSGQLDELRGVSRSAEHAVRLAIKWQHLQHAIDLDSDEQILGCALDELLAEPGYVSQEDKARIALAQGRRRWLQNVRKALAARDAVTLADLFAAKPAGGDELLGPSEQRRSSRLIAQRRAGLRLKEALESGDDRKLVDAMNDIEATGARLPADLDWAGVQVVADRLSIVASIRRAVRANPPDYERLGRMLPAAREAFGSPAPYLGPGLDFAALELDVRREAHRHRLREAIRSGDQQSILTAASPDPYGAIATLDSHEQEQVAAVLARASAANPLKSTDSISPAP